MVFKLNGGSNFTSVHIKENEHHGFVCQKAGGKYLDKGQYRCKSTENIYII